MQYSVFFAKFKQNLMLNDHFLASVDEMTPLKGWLFVDMLLDLSKKYKFRTFDV